MYMMSIFFQKVYAHTSQSNYGSFLIADPSDPVRFFLGIDPTWLLFLVMAFLYLRGYIFFKNKPVNKFQVCLFYLGIAINCFVLSPGFDQLASELFFVHMIQHLAVIIVGTPLLICGVPYLVMLKAFNPMFIKKYVIPIIKSKIIRKIHSFLSISWVGLIFFQFNFWFWHVPRWYNLALFNDYFHVLEHALMALTAIYLWKNIIDPYPMKRSSLPMIIRIGYLASFMMLNIILSAMITFSKTVWYAYELIAMPEWWQYSRLEDQQLGGIIMWIPGGIILFIAMTACYFAWVRREYHKLEQKKSWQSIFIG